MVSDLPTTVVGGGRGMRSHRRTAGGSSRRCSFLVFATYALLCVRVSSFSTTAGGGGCARVGCSRQQRWDEGRRSHVSRRSSSSSGSRARIARTRMVATEGARPAVSSAVPPEEAPPGAAGASGSSVAKAPAGASRLKVASFFFFWYTFNVGYNLCTKFT